MAKKFFPAPVSDTDPTSLTKKRAKKTRWPKPAG
jgi:hypothetical protein